MIRRLEQLITVKGNQLFVKLNVEYENRPTIVFLHDSLGCVSLWRDFPSKLCSAAQCNMLVYDRLGHGISDPTPNLTRTNYYLENEADLLMDVLDVLDIE